jgi:thioredoxin 1
MSELEKIKKKKIKKMLEKTKFPDKPIKLTDDNFDSFIKKYPLIVVDCWADWCMPCKILGPIIDKLAKKYKDKIVFGKLDVNTNKKIPTKFGIRGIPTLLIFKKGKHVDTIVGVLPKESLELKLNDHLK